MVEVNALPELLWPEIDAQVRAHANEFAFIQARVAAESFVRNQAAMAAHRATRNLGFDARMEKKAAGKVVDLLVTRHGEEPNADNSVLVELKMAYPGTWTGNADEVAKDLSLLAGQPNAYSLVLYFAFTRTPRWSPYAPKPKHPTFENGLAKVVEHLGRDAVWRGRPFNLAAEDTEGKAVLLVWKA